MKTAIAYLTKDRVELTKQTFPVLRDGSHALFWFDGSTDAAALDYCNKHIGICTGGAKGVRGGADAAIVYALTGLLSEDYTHIGLCESDVLLFPDWFERTIALFDRGAKEGLVVGAASARAYDDRILIQRSGYAVMHNLGAGQVIFTREAAQRVLEFYRTGWWPDNRAVFSQLSGVDIGRYSCFRTNPQWTTADWNFDAILAQHGLASVALTPCAVEMVGQEPSLEEQGLKLVTEEAERFRDDKAFARFAMRTRAIRQGGWKPQAITRIHRASGNLGASLIFPHQMNADWEGDWRLKWSQGFGPFSWRANADGCRLEIEVFGPAGFCLSGGERAARVTLTDTESGFEIDPEVPPSSHGITQLQVPGGVSLRNIVMTCAQGAVFYGMMTAEPQPETDHKFDYSVLPPV